MKVRTGFVSNSSSSSFVAIWPEKLDHTMVDRLDAFDKILFWNLIEGRVMNDDKYSLFHSVSGERGYDEFEYWLSYQATGEDKNNMAKALGLDEYDRKTIESECFRAVERIETLIRELHDEGKCIIHTEEF